MVERRSPKPFVVGSSPSSPATNFWKRVIMDKFIEYIKDAKIEIQKVIFPTNREIKQSFISVFAVVTVVSLFLSLIDVVMSSILKSVL
jgi:preprotein translocase subunit SecE